MAGFWRKFGKILSVAGPLAAAPFTGGGSLLTTLGLGAKTAGVLGAGLGVAGRLASGAAKHRAEDRGAQAEYDIFRSDVENQRITQANAQALERAKAQQVAEAARMRQIFSADMLGSSRTPSDPRAVMSGAGYLGPEAIAMMRDRAMKALESGSDVPALDRAPVTPQMPKGGRGDSFLRALSLGGTAMDALRESGVLRGARPPMNEQVGNLPDWINTRRSTPVERPPWLMPDEVPPTRFGRVVFPERMRF